MTSPIDSVGSVPDRSPRRTVAADRRSGVRRKASASGEPRQQSTGAAWHILVCSGVRAYSQALAKQVEQQIDLPSGKVEIIRGALELTETISTRGRYAVVLDARDVDCVPVSMALCLRPAVLGVILLGENRWEKVSTVAPRGNRICVLSPLASIERVVDELRRILIVRAELSVEEPTFGFQAPGRARTIEHLTPRQLQVVRFISSGLSNKEIALRLSISEATVKNHVHELLRQLNLTKRNQVVGLLGPSGTD